MAGRAFARQKGGALEGALFLLTKVIIYDNF
jgi:hypothetical protein